ncbi:hypothetical protein BX616_002991, partial [Lobosporangium transversale]
MSYDPQVKPVHQSNCEKTSIFSSPSVENLLTCGNDDSADNHLVSADNISKLAKIQHEFITTFPEHDYLFKLPSNSCIPSLSTPPQTPPEILESTYPTTLSAPSPESYDSLSLVKFSNSLPHSNTPYSFPNPISICCALKQDLLWEGALYVTETHVCFYGKSDGKAIRMIIDYHDLLFFKQQKEVGHDSNSIRIGVRSISEKGSFGTEYVLVNISDPQRAIADIERFWSVRCSTTKGDQQLAKNSAVIVNKSQDRQIRTLDSTINANTMYDGIGSTQWLDSTWTVETDKKSLEQDIYSRTWRQDGTKNANLHVGSRGRSHSSDRVDLQASSMDSTDFFGTLLLRREISPSTCHSSSSSDDSTHSCIGTGDTSNTTIHADDTVAPIPIRNLGPSRSYQGSNIKSPTPPPLLLSPSLPTTKVSHSSSTTRGVIKSGEIFSTVMDTSKGNERNRFENHKERGSSMLALNKRISNSPPLKSNLLESEPICDSFEVPQGPTPCDCERHYKHAILSTIVPMTLEQCFDLLFSGDGAEFGNKLICEARRSVDGSSKVKFTPWSLDSELLTGSKSKWEGRTRQLEYSVSFNIPMLTKASICCLETQKVLRHDNRVIRVCTESKTPSIPFGDQFTIATQICLTWESLGNTRIKCFTQVAFKKSILLGGMIETSYLERSCAFYREIVRQLVDAADTLNDTVIIWKAPSVQLTSEAPNVSHSVTQENVNNSLKNKLDNVSMESPPLRFQITPRSFSESSTALSLLSQQLLRNSPRRGRRPSIISMQRTASSLSPIETFHQVHATALSDRSSGVLDFMQSISPRMASSKELMEQDDQSLSNGQLRTATFATRSIRTVSHLWIEALDKSFAVINDLFPTSSPPETKMQEKAQTNSEAITVPTKTEDTQSAESTQSNAVDAGHECVSDTPDQSVIATGASDSCSSPRQIHSRIITPILLLGIFMTIVNVLHLLSAVSSVATVLQTNDFKYKRSAVEQNVPFDQISVHQYYQKQPIVLPLRIRTEILRAEIQKLTIMLELN